MQRRPDPDEVEDWPGPAVDPRDAPSVDEVEFSTLFVREDLPVLTDDGWRLVLTRYRPRRQAFHQPLFGVPLLLVHGYTQNRKSWSSGQFVRTMLYFGADIYLCDLRGHGKSSVEAQRRHAARNGGPLPDDLHWRWDMDAYLDHDLPAIVRKVRETSGFERIFYCGHSLGGILGYLYAQRSEELMGLVTIGAPSDFARMPLLLRAASLGAPAFFPAVDAALTLYNAGRVALRSAQRVIGRGPEEAFEPVRFERVPFRRVFGWLEQRLAQDLHERMARNLPVRAPLLYHPRNVALTALRILLRDGATDEPRATLEQFARWLRSGRVRSGDTDLAAGLPALDIPLAIFFGDEDPLATVRTTRNVYRSASSGYLLWRPVRGNSHMELTVGRDIRQICYDVRNLMGWALDHGPGASAAPAQAG